MDDQSEENQLAIREERLPTMTAQEKRQIRLRDGANEADAVRDVLASRTQAWYVPANIDQAFRLAETFFQGGMVPKSYTSVAAVFSGMALAMELGLPNPLGALRNIAVVNGTPSLWGDLPLALARGSKRFVEIDEYFITDTGDRISLENGNIGVKIHAAVCDVYTVVSGQKPKRYIELLAKYQHLMGKDSWKNYADDMLKYKARSRALRTEFSDKLNGLAIGEDAFDIHDVTAIQVKPTLAPAPVSPIAGNAGSLKERLKPQAAAPAPVAEEQTPALNVGIKTLGSWLSHQLAKGSLDAAKVREILSGKEFDEWAKTATANDLAMAQDDLKKLAMAAKASAK